MKIPIRILISFIVSILFTIWIMPQNVIAASVLNKSTGNEKKVYTVTFVADGGKVNTSSLNVTFGSKYGQLPIATKENYEFKGWYTYASGGVKITEDSIVSRTISHKLFAHWRGEERDITLDANGGELAKETITVSFGGKYKYQLPTPTRENYNFDGWYTTVDGKVKILTNDIYDENSAKTLYAHWKEKTLEIIFIAYNDKEYSKVVTCGKKYEELPIPVREGYVFGGWYKWDDLDKKNAKAITAENDVTESTQLLLFARWYFAN